MARSWAAITVAAGAAVALPLSSCAARANSTPGSAPTLQSMPRGDVRVGGGLDGGAGLGRSQRPEHTDRRQRRAWRRATSYPCRRGHVGPDGTGARL